MAWPQLFCEGKAGYSDQRHTPVSREEWIQHLLRHKCERFAASSSFIFFNFAYLEKEKVFTLGNMYAAANAFTTKEALLQQLNSEDEEVVKNLIKQIYKSSAKMKGTKAYFKKFGDVGAYYINFLRHMTDDRENFNIFYTLSSPDHHDHTFYNIFEEGRAHLAKIIVKNESEIPLGTNRNDYVTTSEDYLWRRNFLARRSHHYDIFYRTKV